MYSRATERQSLLVISARSPYLSHRIGKFSKLSLLISCHFLSSSTDGLQGSQDNLFPSPLDPQDITQAHLKSRHAAAALGEQWKVSIKRVDKVM